MAVSISFHQFALELQFQVLALSRIHKYIGKYDKMTNDWQEVMVHLGAGEV